MKRLISSSFILLLLLISLWASSAWILGGQNERILKSFMTEYLHNVTTKRNSVFEVELLDFERSIFSSKAKINIVLNPNYSMSPLLESFLPKQSHKINLNAVHGPLIFNRTGVRMGKSLWQISIDDSEVSNEQTQTPHEIKFETGNLLLSFEDSVLYNFSLLHADNSFNMKGEYEIDATRNVGKISSKSMVYHWFNQKIQAEKLEFKFKQHANDSDLESVFEINTNIQKLTFSQPSSSVLLRTSVEHTGLTSFDKRQRNDSSIKSDNLFKFKVNEADNTQQYPIDRAELTLDVNNLNISDFDNLKSSIQRLQNLQNQKEWVLSEQGEFPEGQDQIWQLQDDTENTFKNLTNLVSNFYLREKNKHHNQSENSIKEKDNIGDTAASIQPTFTFLLKSYYKNNSSTFDGSFEPEVDEQNIQTSDISNLSIFALGKLKAQVVIDEEWFKYLSSRLPIKETKFNLVYKQNKLLMQ